MVFNAIFTNISVIPWRSVLLVGETGINQVYINRVDIKNKSLTVLIYIEVKTGTSTMVWSLMLLVQILQKSTQGKTVGYFHILANTVKYTYVIKAIKTNKITANVRLLQ